MRAAARPSRLLNKHRVASFPLLPCTCRYAAVPGFAPVRQPARLFSHSASRLVTPIDCTSFAKGPTHEPLDERTLGAFLDHLAGDYGDSPALVVRQEQQTLHELDHQHDTDSTDCLRYSFAQMRDQADALARGLLAQGFKPGDRIAVYAGNCSAYALLQWATAKASLIMVCLNPAFAGPELMASLKVLGAKMLVLPPSLRGRSNIDLLHSIIPNLRETGPNAVQSDECPELERIALIDNTSLGAETFASHLSEHGLKDGDFRLLFDRNSETKGVPGEDSASNHDVINIQQTSGTTGLPKGVQLTHRNLLNNGRLIGDCMDLKRPPSNGATSEVLINQVPLFHCFGLVLGDLALWTHAGCVVYPAETFDPALGLLAAVEEKATALHGVPTMFIAQLALVKAHAGGRPHPALAKHQQLDFGRLRTGIAAGSPVPPKVMSRLIEEMNLHSLVIQYGQTESAPVVCGSRTSDPVQLRVETVGRVLAHTTIRIVDPSHKDYPSEDMPNNPIGQPGELWSGGYAIMKGYWKDDKETNKAVFTAKDGTRFLKTGDQAVMDKDGYVKIIGRIKDVIIRGGENLFPVTIENRTLQMPGVADVSIVSVPDPVYQETVGAFVQRHDSEAGRALTCESVSRHVRETLSHQSAPEWVWFLGEGEGVPTEFPKTASGKIRKVELRETAKALAGRGFGKVSKRKPRKAAEAAESSSV